ncbi:MAG: 1-acyl-sn-glycerol-3-phosphate acyltransferase [Bacteroidales bacterium]|nr:1-acyl-sn-glycerol-3-phosphate acyltransferase [Bacteroidales bacterium]
MTTEINFDDIRPYNDSEINRAVKRLLEEPQFIEFAHLLFPDLTERVIRRKFKNIHSTISIHKRVVTPVISGIIDKTTKDVTCSGIKNIKKNKNYLFISNHRNILLDSLLLNHLLVKNHFKTVEIAIGDNLLIYPWIANAVKLDKSFIVKRSVPVKQMLDASKQLSAYIRKTITEKKNSIWIAQREGRTKDGDDKTQTSLLKMLNMSGDKTPFENFDFLNIVPVAISYEYDPCDALKITESIAKENNPGYKKGSKDDLRSMNLDISGYKGRVHFSIGKPMSDKLEVLNTIKNKNDQIKVLTSLIDKEIHTNYKLWPANYIAYDLLNKTAEYQDKYSQEEKEAFLIYLNKQINNIPEEKRFNIDLLINMYAQPVFNRIIHNK